MPFYRKSLVFADHITNPSLFKRTSPSHLLFPTTVNYHFAICQIGTRQRQEQLIEQQHCQLSLIVSFCLHQIGTKPLVAEQQL